MFIGMLTTKFFIHGCHSLKDKRRRLSGLRDKFGGIKNIAVCESDHLDAHDTSEISFLCAANEKKIIESALAKIIDHCGRSVDAELVDHRIDWL